MKKLRPHTVDWAQIERVLASADKKLASAPKVLAFDEEACLQQACEATLKASLGFMFSRGFRVRSQPGHRDGGEGEGRPPRRGRLLLCIARLLRLLWRLSKRLQGATISSPQGIRRRKLLPETGKAA
jgi:hypothetical protein